MKIRHFQHKRLFAFLFFIALIVLALFVAAPFVLEQSLNLKPLKAKTLGWIETKLNGEAAYKAIEFTFFPNLGIEFKELSILDRETSKEILSAESLHFILALLPLIKGKLFLKEMVYYRPHIRICRRKDNGPEIKQLFLNIKKLFPKFERLQIIQGQFELSDRVILPGQEIVFSFPDLWLDYSFDEDEGHFEFELMDAVGSKLMIQAVLPLSISAPSHRWEMALKATSVDFQRYAPYIKQYLSYPIHSAKIDFNGKIIVEQQAIASIGSLDLQNLTLNLKNIHQKTIHVAKTRIDYEFKKDDKGISIKKLLMVLDGQQLDSTAFLSRDGAFTWKVISSSSLQAEKLKAYLPVALFPKSLDKFLTSHLERGFLRLIKGIVMKKTSGEKTFNIHVQTTGFSIHTVHQLPDLTGINGLIEITNSQLLFHKFRGFLGTSPFTLEGTVSDYADEKPKYKLKAKIYLKEKEAERLLQSLNIKKLNYTGSSVLSISLTGVKDLHIAGFWDLEKVKYAYSDQFVKNTIKTNKLIFKGLIEPHRITFKDVIFELGDIILSLSVQYQSKGKKYFHVNVTSIPFALDEAADHIPLLRDYGAKGLVFFSAKGTSRSVDPPDILWQADVSLEQVQVDQFQTFKNIEDISGSFFFRENRIDIEQLRARLDHVQFHIKGSLLNRKEPNLAIVVKAPVFDITRFGLVHHEDALLDIRDVEADMVLVQDKILVRSLKAKLNKSVFELKGIIRPWTNIELSAVAERLDLSDVILLTGIRERDVSEEQALKMAFAIDSVSGLLGSVAYKGLFTELTYKEGIIDFQRIRFSLFDGKCTGNLTLDFSKEGIPVYKTAFTAEALSASDVFALLGLKKQIEGRMSMSGYIHSKGAEPDSVKKHLSGYLHFRSDNGMLKNVPFHKKIFNMLNVSKLLKFPLPDISKTGWEYKKRVGDFTFKNGIISTNNLYTQSDNMDTLVIGTLNIVDKTVDLVVGLKPFKSTEKLIHQIPFANFILSDKEGNILTIYFKVTGRWDNPVVTMLPVNSMPYKIVTIFKKVFRFKGLDENQNP